MSSVPKKRGRPRAFEPADVLPRAFETFLRHGYAGTSIDGLAEAMGLNKPSLYAAFGDKRKLFQRVIDERVVTLGRRFKQALERGTSLESALRELLLEAVQVYDEQPGCVVVSGAVTEAAVDDSLALFTREFFERTDRALEKAFAPWVPAGSPVSAATLGKLANGIIHDIALRARVGESKARLRAYAKESARALALSASPSSP
jgi:AcrR family transcriptional regulator